MDADTEEVKSHRRGNYFLVNTVGGEAAVMKIHKPIASKLLPPWHALNKMETCVERPVLRLRA